MAWFLLAMFALQVAFTLQVASALDCTLVESLPNEDGNISMPFLAKQNLFDETILLYNLGLEQIGRPTTSSSSGRFFRNSTRVQTYPLRGEIIGASREFETWGAVYSKDNTTGAVLATFFDESGTYAARSTVFSANEHDEQYRFGSFFASKIGHLAYASRNSSFYVKRTGASFTQTGDFWGVNFEVNVTGRGAGVIHAVALEQSSGQLFFIVQSSNTTYMSYTYNTDGLETTYVQSKLTLGFPVPIQPGWTVRAVGSSSSSTEAGSLLLLVTRVDEELGTTQFRALYTSTYGNSWSENFEAFTMEERVNFDAREPVSVVWQNTRWLVMINTLEGIYAIKLPLGRVAPFAFEWAKAAKAKQLMFAPSKGFAYLPSRTQTSAYFTLIGMQASNNSTKGQNLVRLSCVFVEDDVGDNSAALSTYAASAASIATQAIIAAMLLLF